LLAAAVNLPGVPLLQDGNLQAQAQSQNCDPQHQKKRRKTHSSQQATQAAQTDRSPLHPLSHQWLLARDAVAHLIPSLSPKYEAGADQVHLFKAAPRQLQALLNTLVAAKNPVSAGMVSALGAAVGKWVRHVVLQSETAAAACSTVDLVIGTPVWQEDVYTFQALLAASAHCQLIFCLQLMNIRSLPAFAALRDISRLFQLCEPALQEAIHQRLLA